MLVSVSALIDSTELDSECVFQAHLTPVEVEVSMFSPMTERKSGSVEMKTLDPTWCKMASQLVTAFCKPQMRS